MKPVTKKQEAQARAIVQRAMNQEKARDVAQKRQLIGRCYKYPNRFSDGEQWWLYAVVTAVDEHGRLTSTHVQRDTNGGIQIAVDQYGGLLPNGGWMLIDRAEFLEATLAIGAGFLQALAKAQAEE